MLNRINALRKAGVLGINARNCAYIMPHNPRRLYNLVDNKVLTKRLAEKANISVPKLYGLISSVHDTSLLDSLSREHEDFVIKPAHGSGGKGILIIEQRRNNLFVKPDGSMLSMDQVAHHIENILGGVYSLGGQIDQAIIEYRVNFDPVFNAVSYEGVPDIRILLYKGIPAMAMLRLPTRQSNGKANLHQGAVGVGINLLEGKTTLAVCNNHRIVMHPDFDTPVNNLQIPGWQQLLILAARCHELAPLGYLGVDIVIDKTLGPLILEMNARPGLGIQIANGTGLKYRLDAIDELPSIPAQPHDRVAAIQTLLTTRILQ